MRTLGYLVLSHHGDGTPVTVESQMSDREKACRQANALARTELLAAHGSAEVRDMPVYEVAAVMVP